MKRIALAALLLCLAVPALLAPAFAAAGASEDPSAEVTESVSPDPEVSESSDLEASELPDPEASGSPQPTESPEPTIPPEMEIMRDILSGTLPFFQFKFTVFGFTLSFWDVLLFELIAGILIYLIWRFMR